MGYTTRNVRVIAENIDSDHGFHIFLDFSGQREYLMSHRHNGLLYNVLKDGVALDDMRRWRPCHKAREFPGFRHNSRANGSVQLENMLSHLLVVIDDYMMEREAC